MMAVRLAFKEENPRVLEVSFRYRPLGSRKARSKTLRFNQVTTEDTSGRLVPNSALRAYFDDMVGKDLITAGLVGASTKPQLKANAMRELRSARGKKKYWGAGPVVEAAGPPPPPPGSGLPWGDRSLFDPVAGMAGETTTETGSTFLLLGATKSGKTTFLVNQLNKLEPGAYDLIILFTNSPHAAPLAKLRPDLNVVVVEGYRPEVMTALRQKNVATKNRFRIVQILDDVINAKNDSTLNASLLFWRNSNISSIMLIQDVKMVSRAARGQINHVVMTGWPTPDPIRHANMTFDVAGWAREKMLSSDPDLSARAIRKDDIIRFVQKKIEPKGDILYINQLHGRAPEFVRLPEL
jgi:molybdopterin-guanine dinucleotide biosynthesis protein